jgi:hypothetical protein
MSFIYYCFEKSFEHHIFVPKYKNKKNDEKTFLVYLQREDTAETKEIRAKENET